MKRTMIALAGIVALTGSAIALDSKTSPGASGSAPGQQMQDKGSKPGSPGASGYAPGQEKKSETTGSTSRSDTQGSGSGARSGSTSR